jgi:hypothetical protein
MIRDSLAEDMQRELPVTVTITAQEFGVIYNQRLTPFEYTQYILGRLKVAGAPVEGTLTLRLKYGNLCRVKESIQGPGQFDFMWLPPAWAQAINEQGGLADGTPTGCKMVVR